MYYFEGHLWRYEEGIFIISLAEPALSSIYYLLLQRLWSEVLAGLAPTETAG